MNGVAGDDFVYWTEYSPAVTTGSLRRIRLDGTGPIDTLVNNLNFPAGIATDGASIAICETAGSGGLGRMLLAPINPTSTLNGDDELLQVGPFDQITRPFDVAYDGNNGFFFTQGNAIQPVLQGAPGPLAQGLGVVRFLPSSSVTSSIVFSGLTNAAGIDAIDSDGDGTSSVLFSESIALTGTVRRVEVDTSNPTDMVPTVDGIDLVETGLFNPLGVSIVSETVPTFDAVVNYIGGMSNGSIRTSTATP